jgi:hypothetical protein
MYINVYYGLKTVGRILSLLAGNSPKLSTQSNHIKSIRDNYPETIQMND